MDWEDRKNIPVAKSDLYILKANDSSFPREACFIQTAPAGASRAKGRARLAVQSLTVRMCWQRPGLITP